MITFLFTSLDILFTGLWILVAELSF